MIALLLMACSGTSEPAGPPPSRVQSVAVKPVQERPADDPAVWCDLHTDAETSEPFAWPPLDGAESPTNSGWTWVNAWATWCKPCIEEMPRITTWEKKLQAEVGPGSVQFLSLDATADVLSKFHAAKPEMPTGVRIQEEAAMDPWVKGLGLEPAAAALPIHVFLDARKQTRCVYMGGISEAEYATIKAVLTAL